MLSNLKSLCPKRSLIAIAFAVGMGSICVTNHAYATGNQAKDYAFSHQSVVDVKSTLHSSNLYSLLLALHAQTPEIETTAYHAMVLSSLHEIASNIRASSRPSIEKRYLALPVKKQIALAQKAMKEALDRSIINPNVTNARNYYLWQSGMSRNDSMQSVNYYFGTYLTNRLLDGVKVDRALYRKVHRFAQTCTGTVLAYSHRSFYLTSNELWHISKDRNFMVTIDDKVANCRDAGDALEAKLNATTLQQNFAKLGFDKKIPKDSKTSPKNKLLHINVPRILEGDGSIQQFIPPKNAGDGGITIVQSEFKNWPDAKQLSRLVQSTYNHLKESKGRHSDQGSCELNRGK